MSLSLNRSVYAGVIVYVGGMLALLYAFVGDPPDSTYTLLFDGGLALSIIGGLVLGYGVYAALKPADT